MPTSIDKLNEIRTTTDPKSIQVSGSHYKGRKLEPLEFLQLVGEHYGYTIASACKYVLRYKNKNQFESDLLKIAHYAKLNLMFEAKAPNAAVRQVLLDMLPLLNVEENSIAYQMTIALFDKNNEQLFNLIEQELNAYCTNN